MRWLAPTVLLARRRFATRSPGRVLFAFSDSSHASGVPPVIRMNLHAAVEVHSVDTDSRVVFDTQINVFTDAKPEIARR